MASSNLSGHSLDSILEMFQARLDKVGGAQPDRPLPGS